MGCVSSKAHLNDTAPNIFEVMNVDEMGHLLSPGQLELTSTDLILHQKGKTATKWPLRCLRKYGFDTQIFSFECGRSSPTGPGIYAFQCRRAEQLFNLLQQNIQIRNINDETTWRAPPVHSNTDEFPVPVVNTGIPSPDTYLNPSPTAVVTRPHPCLSRPGSLNSNGPNSPGSPPVVSPPPDILEHNNNKEADLPLCDHTEADKPPYININSTKPGPAELYANINMDHVYVNIDANDRACLKQTNTLNTKDMPNIANMTDSSLEVKESEDKHCYANVDRAELGGIRAILYTHPDIPLQSASVPETPTYATGEVNYAELELGPSKSEHASLQVTPDSPNKPNKNYAIIDIQKTNAISQIVNPSIEVEEGSRKTRHNSTISDKIARNSNSLSD